MKLAHRLAIRSILRHYIEKGLFDIRAKWFAESQCWKHNVSPNDAYDIAILYFQRSESNIVKGLQDHAKYDEA